jgi:hypothetical protein
MPIVLVVTTGGPAALRQLNGNPATGIELDEVDPLINGCAYRTAVHRTLQSGDQGAPSNWRLGRSLLESHPIGRVISFTNLASWLRLSPRRPLPSRSVNRSVSGG